MPKIYGNTEINGDVLILGSFSILGSYSIINTTSLTVEDSIIVLSHSQSTPVFDSGIFIDRGTGGTQGMIWDETNDVWSFISTDSDHVVSGTVNILDYSNIRAKGATFNQIKITDGAQDGYFLKSDSNGLSSWSQIGMISNSVYYVSADYGNDITAQVGSIQNMYATIFAAVQQAWSDGGGNVHVFPGTYYNSTNILYDNVNIHFEKGTVINCDTTTPFTDISGSITAAITGWGEFNCNVFYSGYLVHLVDGFNSNITFECDIINSNAGSTFFILNGILKLKCREIYENLQYVFLIGQEDDAVGRTNGTVIVDVDYIYAGTGAGAINFQNACLDNIERYNYFNVRLIETLGTGNWGGIFMFFSNEACKVYFNGEIRNISPTFGGFVGSVFGMIGSGTIVASGRFTAIADYVAAIYGNGGTPLTTKSTIIIKDSFVISNSTGSSNAPSVMRCNNPNGYIKIINSYVVGYSSAVIKLGETGIFGSDTNGNIEIHNSRIHARSTSSNVYNIRKGGGNLTLNNVVFYNDGLSGESIYSSTPQTVKIYGQSLANFGVNVNVTPTIGTLIVDTGITPQSNINE